MLDSLIPPLPSVAAYIVSEHILLPATIYVDVHGTYCHRTAYIVADNICWVLRHILSPVVTYCRRRQCMQQQACVSASGWGGWGGGGVQYMPYGDNMCPERRRILSPPSFSLYLFCIHIIFNSVQQLQYTFPHSHHTRL